MRFGFVVTLTLAALLVAGGGLSRAVITEAAPADPVARMDAFEKRLADLEKAAKPAGGTVGDARAADAVGAGNRAEVLKSIDDRFIRIEGLLRSSDQSFADVKRIAENTRATWDAMYWVVALMVVLVVGWLVVVRSSRRYLQNTTEDVRRRMAATTGIRNRPLVASVVPATGVTSGESPITITGQDFQLGATVKFGGNVAAAVVVNASDTITARSAPGLAGPVDVTVENRDGGASTLRGAFTYVLPAPIVRGITPSTGPAATPLRIWGGHFQPGATMSMDGTAVPVTWLSENELTAQASPATPGGCAKQLANVVVTNPDRQSSPVATHFTYP